MNNLKEMDLSGNLLVSISAPVFTGLEDELRVLRISQNRISSFIGRPLDLPHLNTLDLSKNELSELPRNVFALLPELKYLNLSDNRLLASIPGNTFLLIIYNINNSFFLFFFFFQYIQDSSNKFPKKEIMLFFLRVILYFYFYLCHKKRFTRH